MAHEFPHAILCIQANGETPIVETSQFLGGNALWRSWDFTSAPVYIAHGQLRHVTDEHILYKENDNVSEPVHYIAPMDTAVFGNPTFRKGTVWLAFESRTPGRLERAHLSQLLNHA